MKKISYLIFILCTSSLFAQTYTRADSLQGSLRPERTAIDVYHYDLNLEFDLKKQFIKGYVDIYYEVKDDQIKSIQIDLENNLKIIDIKDKTGNSLFYTREENAVFIQPNTSFVIGERTFIRFSYEGSPTRAENPPWEGGFVWKTDKEGFQWVSVACEQEGAKVWWPNKDTWSDEADSVKINITCSSDYTAISNGNLIKKTTQGNKTTFHWLVSYPINNYNVTFYIGKYVNFSEKYFGQKDTFDLDYYVLDYSLDLAKKHFEQVPKTLHCLEEFLGPFPFPRDGYGLVESPFAGMEHQGAIAYGNGYENDFMSPKTSNLPISFDHIILHENGHEWWGNNVTAKEIADMWIHEGFCTYSEALVIECMYGPDTALQFCNGWKKYVKNDQPIISDYGVFKQGSQDMYRKAALMLHTLRWLVNNDVKWFALIKNIQTTFKYKTTTGKGLINYINNQLGEDYTWLFNQYLKVYMPPQLNCSLLQNGDELVVTLAWTNVVNDFRLPIEIGTAKNLVKVTATIQPIEITLPNTKMEDFIIDQDHAYFIVAFGYKK